MTKGATPKQVRVCGTGDVPLGEARRYTVEGFDLCVAHCEDGFHVVADQCSHEDYSLSEGEIDASACEIECWKHGSLFSLTTGEPLTLPATMPVAVYPVTVEGNDVMVAMS